MRGLKQLNLTKYKNLAIVASFTDAWIETLPGMDSHRQNQVASFTDAWIET